MENKTNKNPQSIFANLFVLFFLAFVIFSSLNSKSIERTTFVIEKGMRIAQLIIAKVEKIKWRERKKINEETKRKNSGFGSTGL